MMFALCLFSPHKCLNTNFTAFKLVNERTNMRLVTCENCSQFRDVVCGWHGTHCLARPLIISCFPSSHPSALFCYRTHAFAFSLGTLRKADEQGGKILIFQSIIVCREDNNPTRTRVKPRQRTFSSLIGLKRLQYFISDYYSSVASLSTLFSLFLIASIVKTLCQ